MHGPAERPRGLRPAGVGRFRLRTQAAVFSRGQWRGQRHAPLARPRRRAAAQKRRTVARVSQTHTGPPASLPLLPQPGPPKCRSQTQDLVHRPHRRVSGRRPAGRVSALHAVVDWLLLSRVRVKHGANQGRRATGIAGVHPQRMDGRSLSRSASPTSQTSRGVERFRQCWDGQQDAGTALRTHEVDGVFVA